MRQDGRLARMIHVLVHMGLLGGKETSGRIAEMLATNPVVVRRTMGLLREHGIVRSEGGRGGGWHLARPLGELTVLDVLRALQDGQILDPGLSDDHPACPVEQAANAVLTSAYADAETRLVERFAGVTLADVGEAAMKRANSA